MNQAVVIDKSPHTRAPIGASNWLGGIGRIISSGIGFNDNDRILGGALLVTILALVVDGMLALVQRFVSPRALRTPIFTPRAVRRETSDTRAASAGRRAVAEASADEGK